VEFETFDLKKFNNPEFRKSNKSLWQEKEGFSVKQDHTSLNKWKSSELVD
jgi:hypothetical protein